MIERDESLREWWSGTAGMQDGGALLVRPDQHVAARFTAGTAASAELARALAACFVTSRTP
jgi:hypothetical protein